MSQAAITKSIMNRCMGNVNDGVPTLNLFFDDFYLLFYSDCYMEDCV